MTFSQNLEQMAVFTLKPIYQPCDEYHHTVVLQYFKHSMAEHPLLYPLPPALGIVGLRFDLF